MEYYGGYFFFFLYTGKQNAVSMIIMMTTTKKQKRIHNNQQTIEPYYTIRYLFIFITTLGKIEIKLIILKVYNFVFYEFIKH